MNMYMLNNTRVLRSLGTQLSATGLTAWQQDRSPQGYVLAFPEFREESPSSTTSGGPSRPSAVGTTQLARSRKKPTASRIGRTSRR